MRYCRFAFVCLLIAVTVLSLLPIGHPSVAPNDKLNHLLAWGALGFLGGLGWRGRWQLWPLLWAYSWLIEVLQGVSGYRLFSLADGFANLAGLLLGIVLVGCWVKMRRGTDTGAGRPE